MLTTDVERELLVTSLQDVLSTMMRNDIVCCDSDGEKDLVTMEHITATIGFAGGWNGFVSIACSTAAARLITGLLLGTGNADIPDDEIRDAVGEVVNMVGGRFKALFSAHQDSGKEVFKMSIPSVIQGREYNVFAPANSIMTKVIVKIRDEKLSALLALSRDNES